MDTERNHLVEPIRHRERGLALWVGLALGFAGIIVTIGGIYEWNARKAGGRPSQVTSSPSTAAAAPAVKVPLQAEDPEVAELRRQLAEERRARIQAEADAFQREQEAARRRPRRCIDGVRFEQFGQEWRNVGRC